MVHSLAKVNPYVFLESTPKDCDSDLPLGSVLAVLPKDARWTYRGSKKRETLTEGRREQQSHEALEQEHHRHRSLKLSGYRNRNSLLKRCLIQNRNNIRHCHIPLSTGCFGALYVNDAFPSTFPECENNEPSLKRKSTSRTKSIQRLHSSHLELTADVLVLSGTRKSSSSSDASL